MRLKALEATGFKSFAKKTTFTFAAPITAIVGPNGSGKSNAADACRFVLGEKSMKTLRSRRGEDLIFGGGPTLARMNRAAVSLVFDNGGRDFGVDYDEVILTREVLRDGTNTYLLNGSPVRWRQVVELLNRAALGAADRYIIGQGEADRVLLTSEEERRAMVEDALGLRIYQYKIEESEKKLKKAEENLGKVESLRQEIAPHLRFLSKQVKRIEAAANLRQELVVLYRSYLPAERVFIEVESKEIRERREKLRGEMALLEKELQRFDRAPAAETVTNKRLEELLTALRRLQEAKEGENRRLGRLEAMIEVEKGKSNSVVGRRVFDAAAVGGLVEDLNRGFERLVRSDSLAEVKRVAGELRDMVSSFWRGVASVPAPVRDRLRDLVAEKKEAEERLAELIKQEATLVAEREELQIAAKTELEMVRQADRRLFELRSGRQELESGLSLLVGREERLSLIQTDFGRELEEGGVLLGRELVAELKNSEVAGGDERALQEERRRKIERLKIRLEDLGLGQEDILREYHELSERDLHLAREIDDLKQTATALQKIITDLRQKIETEFAAGLKRINGHFQEFVILMFGGGRAGLELVRPRKDSAMLDEEEGEGNSGAEESVPAAFKRPGLAVKISLPRKKIRGLAMLSGGERALVSIALLFAMSQVNPPPFLILDETDATLDEANSRRYGEMLQSLSRHSQLVVITHNRETMSRAGVIYGVTMSQDGVSRLLSIRFADAVGYAK